MTLHEQIQAMAPDLTENRRWLHSHAELSFQEYETSAWIYEQLSAVGERLQLSRPTPTSVMAVLRTGRPGPVVAVRADIDALPMEEATGLPYASKNTGVMHACGHDGHGAVLLGAARVLTGMADQLCGEVRFIFQHAEEAPPGGAAEVIAAGVLDGVEEVYGYHFTSTLETGSFGVRSGVLTSATDGFSITVRGKGGHSSLPQECIDPVVIGAQIVLALQSIVSRRLDPADVAVLSVCHVEAGSAYNIIPHTMALQGSVRTFSEQVRGQVQRWIGETAQGIAAAQGATAECSYRRGYGSVVNDPALTALGEQVIRERFGPRAVVPIQPQMPGDDFCHYHQGRPGFFVEIGAASQAKGIVAPHHNPHYQLDEDALPLAVEYVTALLCKRLGRQ